MNSRETATVADSRTTYRRGAHARACAPTLPSLRPRHPPPDGTRSNDARTAEPTADVHARTTPPRPPHSAVQIRGQVAGWEAPFGGAHQRRSGPLADWLYPLRSSRPSSQQCQGAEKLRARRGNRGWLSGGGGVGP